jgi:hypothetical protein
MAKRPKRFYEGGMDEKEPGWESKEAPAVSPKSNIVTKEQLAESGLSLRDYMNKQQGLTRRGEPAPVPVPKSESEPETKSAPKPTPFVRRVGREEAESSISKAAEPSSVRKLSREEGESIKKASAPAKSEPVDETKLSANERFKLTGKKLKDVAASARSGSGPTDTRSVNERIRSTFGFAKGGKVSSASSRADGIATKGKTRGRMC